ncbi:amidohydrolase [Paenibacillaceae bacterium]|nr:amidohydrolase [Paenibacillaceae bacterium]
MYIDSHIHFWQLERGDYYWLKPESKLLYRNYLPEQLLPELTNNQVEGVIAVQAASTVAETDYLLDLAERHRWILGVVGGFSPLSPDFMAEYDRLRQRDRFAGIRIDGACLAAVHTAESDLLLTQLRKFADDQFPIDLLIRTHDLDNALACLAQVPELRVVINHLGAPYYADEDDLGKWSAGMEQAAQYPGATCKISGIITQAAKAGTAAADPYIKKLFACFGAERLMFGSDWPVALQGGGYEQVVELFESLLPASLSEADKEKVRSDNAKAFYLK